MPGKTSYWFLRLSKAWYAAKWWGIVCGPVGGWYDSNPRHIFPKRKK